MKSTCSSLGINYVHLDVTVDHAAPIHNKIATSANYITDYALNHKFDYLYIVECDVLPGSTSLNKLLKYLKEGDYQAVMGSYYSGYSYTRFKLDPFFLTGMVFWNEKLSLFVIFSSSSILFSATDLFILV